MRLLYTIIGLCVVFFSAASALAQDELYGATADGRIYLININPDSISLVRTLPSAYTPIRGLTVAGGYFYASYGNGNVVRFGFTSSDEVNLGASGVFRIAEMDTSPDGRVYAAVSKDNDSSLTTESLGEMNLSNGDFAIVAGPFEINPPASDRFTRNVNSIAIDAYGRFFAGTLPLVYDMTFVPGGDMSLSFLFQYPGGSPANHITIVPRFNTSSATKRIQTVASDTQPGIRDLIQYYAQDTSGITLDIDTGGDDPLIIALTYARRCSTVGTGVKIQNYTYTVKAEVNSQDTIEAGSAVDSGQTQGPVVINASGELVTFRAANSINLAPGFSVEVNSQFRAFTDAGLCL